MARYPPQTRPFPYWARRGLRRWERGNKGTKTDPPLTYINGGALGLFFGLDKHMFQQHAPSPAPCLFPTFLLHHCSSLPIIYSITGRIYSALISTDYVLKHIQQHIHIHTNSHPHSGLSTSAQLEPWRLQVFAQTVLPCSMVPRSHAPFQQLPHLSTTLLHLSLKILPSTICLVPPLSRPHTASSPFGLRPWPQSSEVLVLAPTRGFLSLSRGALRWW